MSASSKLKATGSIADRISDILKLALTIELRADVLRGILGVPTADLGVPPGFKG